MWVHLLSGLALVSAALHIRAEYLGPRASVYVFKPITTFILLLVTILPSPPETNVYSRWILAGVILSLIGDVLLMLPQDRFALGLGSFLLAHVVSSQ